jgi:hypothetical protein
VSEYAVPNDGAPPVESPKTSDLFRRMADQIDRNDSVSFGGAYVICPPDGGEPIELLMLKSKDVAQFWGAVDAMVKMVMSDLDDKSRNQQAFRQR